MRTPSAKLMACPFLWFVSGALALILVCGRVGIVGAQETIDPAKLPPPAKGTIDFVKQIQPLFTQHCAKCHGAKRSESGLRLDVKAAALAGGDNGPVIVPGKSASSPLVHRVAGATDDDRMPPEDEGVPLTAAEIGLVRAWIDAGATWPDEADPAGAARTRSDHWAFQPIRRPPLPPVRRPDWVRNPIDAFVLARLEAEGIEPAPEADRATLARRLFLDLHGLPPAPAELEEFLADTRSDAYEKLVDRLLASPRYGERWARHWLDLARYADSDGYEKDNPRPHAWRWRQWVIEALNNDVPFDQFTVQQLAGDMLPDATLDERVATGFHRNTLINTEGGTDKEEDRVKRTVDRTNTLGSVWLGITLECAHCHTHKYDPISQREYFGMYAFFNSMSEPDIPAPLPEQAEAYRVAKEAFDKEHAPLVAAVQEYEAKELSQKLAAWEKTFGEQVPTWSVLKPSRVTSAEGTTLTVQADGSVLAGGKNPAHDEYTLVTTTTLRGITAIRVEALPDASLPHQGPGRSDGGNFVLTTLRLSAKVDSGEEQVTLRAAQADFSQDGWPVAAAIDDDEASGWAVSPQFGKPHVAVFETGEDLGAAVTENAAAGDAAAPVELTIVLQQHYQSGKHNLGRFRISVTTMPRPVRIEAVPEKIAGILAVAPDSRTPAQHQELLAYYRTIAPEFAKLKQAADEHAKKAPPDPGQKVKAQAIAELPQPRETHLHIRGNFLDPGPAVAPQTPSVLHPLKRRGEKPDRLDLAHWVVDPANPLTPRVTVNRIWQRYFGRGLVVTSNDFGTQGEPPSHPELLDWLATQFRDGGWRMKALHRLIVTSSTYRQSSVARPDLAERDPYNVLLARQNRLRVEAEVVRDLALASSGLLCDTVGGPSVRPRQPDGVDSLGYAGSVKWVTSQGEDRYRRGLYTFFQRTVPYPMLTMFDAPDGILSCTRRERSNTPLQSLTLWNDPVFFECAQALGARIVAEAPSASAGRPQVDQRIRYACRLCLARDPGADELDVLRQLYANQLAQCQADPKSAEALAGAAARRPDVPLPELAAWVAVGRTLMNLDEFITRQ